VYPHLRAAQFPNELDAATAGGRRAGPVLDPAAADPAQVVIVDHGTVGNEQLDSRVVDVEVDLDLSGLDLRE
jgi:hypothetical protein